MIKNTESEKNKFNIEKIPKKTRKAILLFVIFVVAILMIYGLVFSSKKLFKNEEYKKSELEEIKENLNSIFEETKSGMEYAKEKIKVLAEKDVLKEEIKEEQKTYSESDLAKIKEKIILMETQGWQSYKDEDYKFEIKYPDDLFLRTDIDLSIISLSDQERNKYIEIKKYDLSEDLQNNSEIKKYLQKDDYYLVLVDFKNNTTTSFITETFKIFE